MDNVYIGLTSSNRATFAEKRSGLGSMRQRIRLVHSWVGSYSGTFIRGEMTRIRGVIRIAYTGSFPSRRAATCLRSCTAAGRLLGLGWRL